MDRRERVARVLTEHRRTTGMAVAMATTCRCGYWTGSEQPVRDRPVGLADLTWHQAEMVLKALEESDDE